MKKLLCVLLAALMLLSLCACNNKSDGESSPYKKALDDYFDIKIGTATKEQYVRMRPDSNWEYLEEEGWPSANETWEIYQERAEETVDNLEYEYGGNINVTYKVIYKEKLDQDDLEEMAETLDKYGIKDRNVKQAYEVEVEYTIKGDSDEETDEIELTVVKIENDWYVYENIMSRIGS